MRMWARGFCRLHAFTTLSWDEALQVLRSQRRDNPFRDLPDDTEVAGVELSVWWETVVGRLAAASCESP
jgi:hypothetical protein